MSSPDRKIEVGIFMAFSVIFRVPGQMSRFRGHFPPVSRFCAPLCRAGNSREEKLTAGSFSSEIFYQKCPCPRKCPNGHKSQICACFIGFCTKPPTKVREERTKKHGIKIRQPFFHRNFDKNACFLSPHCLLYSYKNSGWFLCRSSAWAPPGRTEEAA